MVQELYRVEVQEDNSMQLIKSRLVEEEIERRDMSNIDESLNVINQKYAEYQSSIDELEDKLIDLENARKAIEAYKSENFNNHIADEEKIEE